jgi:ABC-type multidrug transport system fused ATPase/permease subunit
MLVRLVWRYLKPHWPLLVGVVVFQLAQSIASLYLPTLNADIIDNGIAKGDTAFCQFVNDALQASVADGTYAAAWKATADTVQTEVPTLPPADSCN